jgi:hypothetical protein
MANLEYSPNPADHFSLNQEKDLLSKVSENLIQKFLLPDVFQQGQ